MCNTTHIKCTMCSPSLSTKWVYLLPVLRTTLVTAYRMVHKYTTEAILQLTLFKLYIRHYAVWTEYSYYLYTRCTVQYNTVQYSTVPYSTVQYSVKQCRCEGQCSTVEYKYNTVQYCTVQYSTVPRRVATRVVHVSTNITNSTNRSTWLYAGTTSRPLESRWCSVFRYTVEWSP